MAKPSQNKLPPGGRGFGSSGGYGGAGGMSGGGRSAGRLSGSRVAMRSVPKPTTRGGARASGLKGPVTPKRVAAMKTQAKKLPKGIVKSKLQQIERDWNKPGKGRAPMKAPLGIPPNADISKNVSPREPFRKVSNSLETRWWWHGWRTLENRARDDYKMQYWND